MTFQKIKYKAFVLLAGWGVVCAGCHHSDEPTPGSKDPATSEPEKLTLCLNVSFDGQDPQTRAGEPNDYEDPTGAFENVKSLRVIIVRQLSAGKGTVEANRLVATNDNGKPKSDNLEFEVIANEDKRIYLVANESSLQPPEPSPTNKWETAGEFLRNYKVGTVHDLDSLANWTVSIPDIKTDTETNTKYVNEGLFSDSKALLPTLPLTEFFDIYVDKENVLDETCYTNLFITRAAAKATFYVDYSKPSSEYDNVKIEAITLSGIGSQEYVFPKNTVYSKDKYQGNNKLTSSDIDINPNPEDLNRYITSFDTPSGSIPLTYVLLDKDEATKTYKKLDIDIVPKNTDGNTDADIPVAGPIYFPGSILNVGRHYEVGVLLSTGVWLTAPLETKDDNIANILDINGRKAIARNTHLKIKLSFTPQELDAEVDIVPYIGISLEPGFGFGQLLPGDHHQPVDW